MNVLSLFDGISCGRLALERAGVKVNKYFASEVDTNAIKVSTLNWPDIIHIGDITKIDRSILDEPIDLLIGGSPCQNLSFFGKLKGMSTKEGLEVTNLEQYLELKNRGYEFEGESYLFWEYMRLYHEYRPRYFLLENVPMQPKWKDTISGALNCEPYEINSSLVVPQSRRRLYWTNIKPKLKQIDWDLNDYLAIGEFPSQCDKTRYFKRTKMFHTITATYYKGIRGCRPAISTKEGYMDDGREYHRMLSPEECERLQTLPLGYTSVLSNTQRYKTIGNGWTVDLLSQIFSGLKDV